MDDSYSMDFGLTEIEPGSYGEPGSRTFNIAARSDRGEAIVWMEKEQLAYTAHLINRNLSKTRSETPTQDYSASPPGFEPPGRAEFKATEMSLEYSPLSQIFTLRASGEVSEEVYLEAQFSFTTESAKKLSALVEKIVASGRPICPLCDTVVEIGTKHLCVNYRNGHTTL